VSWPVLFDGDGKVSRAYGLRNTLFVLVNKEGNVVYRDNEPPSDVRNTALAVIEFPLFSNYPANE